MTRAQAIEVLEAIGLDESERLLALVRAGPQALGFTLEQRIEKLIAESHIRTGYDP